MLNGDFKKITTWRIIRESPRLLLLVISPPPHPASTTFPFLPLPSNAPPPSLPLAIHPSFDLLPALLCWSSNHNPGPWQMEDRKEKLLTSQPEPLLSAHQLLPASPPCLQNSYHYMHPTHPQHLWGHGILLGNGACISPYLDTLERTWKHNRWMLFITT